MIGKRVIRREELVGERNRKEGSDKLTFMETFKMVARAIKSRSICYGLDE